MERGAAKPEDEPDLAGLQGQPNGASARIDYMSWTVQVWSLEPKADRTMPTIAQIPGGVRIEQYYGDHPPAHFHALHGDDSAAIGIALGFKLLSGKLKPGAMRDVIEWATPRRAQLALNWVDAAAQEPIQRIP